MFRNTILFNKLSHRDIFPNDEPLPEQRTPVPIVVVADDAFSPTRNILKPFNGSFQKGTNERIFNYRISGASRVIENVPMMNQLYTKINPHVRHMPIVRLDVMTILLMRLL